MKKEKTLGLLSERICGQCAKDPDSVIKHGCCQHFIAALYNDFFPKQQTPSNSNYSPSSHSHSLQFSQCVATAPIYGKPVASTTFPTSLLPVPALFT